MSITAGEYFLSKRPGSGKIQSCYTGIANAFIRRGDDITMEQLCEMPEKDMKSIRLIGEKKLAIVLEECRNYNEGK